MRRTVWVIVAIVAMGLLLAGDGLLTEKQPADAQSASRPNFVFVMTDDLDERSMQELGGIRRVMGSKGTTFKNAYVNYALCCPSRVSFFRGQYPHNHGITGAPDSVEPRFRELGRDQSTIATWLNDAGYETLYLGKYLNEYVGPYIPPGWDEWFALSGDEPNNEVNDDGQVLTLAGNSTDAFADEAADFIRRSSATPDPFFVVVGTRAPHRPAEVPARYQDSFADAQLPTPPNFDESDVSDKPAWVQSYPRLTLAQINKERNLYRQRLRSMLAVEDLLRQTIATLKETGELANTYIFFTSDNGFHQGQHRLPGDKKTPYEEDIGVPLMVRGPGVPAGKVRKQLVINNDFAPTLADLAGASIPPFVDGRSFAPLLTNSPPTSWRTAFLEEGTWQPYFPPVPTNKGVHTHKHLYVEYDTGEYELYDLVLDPYQLESMPRAGNEQLYSELQTRLDALRNCSGDGCQVAEWTTDTTAPRIVSTVSKANATGVGPTTNVTATFSEGMDSDTVTGRSFRLYQQGHTRKLAAAVSYPAGTNRAKLDPTEPLQEGLTYMAVVGMGARDLAGNQLDQSSSRAASQKKVWSFTVGN